MGTANTMDIFTEALGLSISGSSTIPANSDARMECAHKTGELAVSLSQSSRKPSEIVTANSIYNGLIILAALSGSLNHLLHVPAVAKTIGVEIDFDTIAEINEKTPQLCTINPSGPHSIMDLHEAGGIPAVIKELLPLLHQECINVEGRRVDEIAASAMNLKPDVIRSIAEPVSTRGGIIILKGNIARQGAAMRLSTIPEGMDQFSGLAHVFDSEEAAMQAVNAGEIPEGAVVVVRNEGPRGGPGMREMHRLVGAFAGKRIAVITDGRFSGATGGLSIGYLCPEAALGGEIACVQNGDMISIDIRKRTIDLIITPDVIVERMSKINFAEPQKETRLLEKYARSVGSAFTGAVEP